MRKAGSLQPIGMERLKSLENKKIGCLLVTHGSSSMMERISKVSGAPLNTHINPLGTLFTPSETLYFDLMDDTVNAFKACETMPITNTPHLNTQKDRKI